MSTRAAVLLALGPVGLAATTTLIAAEREAAACGGCFAPPAEITTVDSHRMVIALGVDETVLWDQIVYSGDPSEFVWVLPVPSPEVDVEVADPAFFDQLDGLTAPTIQPASPPPRTFCPSGAGLGCGDVASSDDAPGTPSDNVTIYDEGVVGPYQTLVIGSEDPEALHTWLREHDYEIPNYTLPTLAYYVDQGSAFVVLRLQPGADVSAMEPVRVRYPSYMASFPLKMVVVGAKGRLDMSLWVIAEQRYEARNYGTVRVDSSDLSWDWATNRSNYDDVFEDTIARAGGRAWVVEHASALDDVLGQPTTDDQRLIEDLVPYAYVTRLRTRVLVDHIDQDIQLSPAADTGDVPRWLSAPIDVNRPPDIDCDDGCSVRASRRAHAAFTGLVIALGVALAIRRRRRR